MKSNRRIVPALLMAIAASALAGCAGDSARVNALGPAIGSVWPAIRDDADLGIRARGNPAAAAALGVSVEGPGVSESRRNRLQQFDAAVAAFNREGVAP